ncbi:MAG TPA: transporter [Candidatus Omnitrophota bacterium]|nr:transporter [Candidatus Omnitrophota bacterium]
MIKKTFPYIMGVITISLLLALGALRSRYSKATRDMDGLAAQIRQEIRKDIRAEVLAQMEPFIAEEIRREVDSYLARKAGGEADGGVNPQGLPRQVEAILPGEESIREAVRRTVRETVEQYNVGLTDKELDRFIAGQGIELDVQVPGVGMMRAPSQDVMLLASASHAEKTPKKQAAPSQAPEPEGGTLERVDSIERTLVQKGSILLPKGKLQFEPSLTYAHFSSNRININGFSILPILVIGDINTEKVKRDVFIHTWAFKYGLLHNLQTEVRVPGRFEYDRVTNTDSTTYDQTDSKGGLGDIQVSISRQIGWEHGIMPDLVASLSVKSNTGDEPYNTDIAMGTGHWAVSGALVGAKASDPAVVFGSINYTYNIPRGDIENFGEVDPGDSIGYSLGTAIALSYQTAINFSFDHTVTGKMNRDGRDVPGSFQNAANFKTGFNWALSERASMDFAVSLGLTSDAPDMTFEVRFPYSF